MHAARAARLFFLTQTLEFLICGVVVAVGVVDAKVSSCHCENSVSDQVANTSFYVICNPATFCNPYNIKRTDIIILEELKLTL